MPQSSGMFSASSLLYVFLLASGGSQQSLPLQRVRNANHLFNAIHSSMRQWGSSLNHNGMSFFPAKVPKGTELYHGTGEQEPVAGMEWLAFEPEHAMLFSRKWVVPPTGKLNIMLHPDTHLDGIRDQVFLASGELPDPPEFEPGWLHTYRTKHDLHLLYIDGMSAGKVRNGTLDSTDFLLLNKQIDPIWEDYDRATQLCDLAKYQWGERVHGFIRMEAGFEIILCSFSNHLEIERITRATKQTNGVKIRIDDALSFWRAITDRYNEIGGHRVHLNYDNFVSAYQYDIDVFRGQKLPRLEHIPIKDLVQIRSDLTTLLDHNPDPFTATSHDWRSVADLIVTRYSSRLKYLASGILDTSEAFFMELERAVRPFLDYDNPDTEAEKIRCTNHFLPTPTTNSHAARVITDVSHTICSTLITIHRTNLLLEDAVEKIQHLIAWLGWTVWKQCSKCDYNEVCFIPIWPMGTKEDYDHPSCINSTQLITRTGYWGLN
jgi:hypothetical protein